MQGVLLKLNQLPTVLEFTGEFGNEINSFIPFIHWLFKADQLQGRKIRTYRGMRPFYFFLSDDMYEEKNAPRYYVDPKDRPSYLPNLNDHRSNRAPDEWFPDYRRFYKTDFGFDKPLLLVQNKYTSEWGAPPVNFFDEALLRHLFGTFGTQFQIVYFPAVTATQLKSKIAVDMHQAEEQLDEHRILRDYADVLVFDDLLARTRIDYNQLKLMLFASSNRFLIIQGGNTHLASLFPSSVSVFLHIKGQETDYSYANGHFQYASNPKPIYLICRNASEFKEASQAIAEVEIVDDLCSLSSRGMDLYKRFGEFRLNKAAPTQRTLYLHPDSRNEH